MGIAELSRYRVCGGVITRQEEDDLVQFFSKGRYNWDFVPRHAREWLVCQALLNDLTTALLNGVTVVRSKFDWQSLIYRFVQPRIRLWRGSAHTTYSALAQPSTETEAGELARQLLSGPISIDALIHALRRAEDFLLRPPAGLRTRGIRIEPDDLSSSKIGADLGRSLLAIGGEAATILVHGSVADGTSTLFSDFDDAVVVHRTAWQGTDSFSRLAESFEHSARLMQLQDPFQHHGHIVLLEFDLALLDQSILPAIVLENSKRLSGRQRLEVTVWEDFAGLGHNIWDLVQDLRSDVARLARERLNAFYLKRMISTISLLPALVLQMGGAEIDKRTAICQVKDVFSPVAASAVAWATRVRQDWGQIAPLKPNPSWTRQFGAFLPFRRTELERIAAHRSSLIAPLDLTPNLPTLLNSILCLSDECLVHVRRNQLQGNS